MRGHQDVEELFAALGKLDAGDRQGLQQSETDGDRESGDGDREVRSREPVPAVHDDASSAISTPCISWCSRPQYSWQAIRYSPGAKLIVNWVT